MQRVEGRQSRPHGEPHTDTHSDRVGTPFAFVLIPLSHSQDASAPRCREWRPVRQNRSDGTRLGEHRAPLEDSGPKSPSTIPTPPSMQRFNIAERRIEIHVSKLLFVLLYCNSLLDRQPPPPLVKLNVLFFFLKDAKSQHLSILPFSSFISETRVHISFKTRP